MSILTRKEFQADLAKMWSEAVHAEYKAQIEAAVLEEREACAKVCDDMEEKAEGTECCKWPTPADCAYAIRARGQA